DEQIERAEMLDGALHHFVHLIGNSYVDLHRERINARLAQRVRTLFQVPRVAAADGDARAQRTEALRDREADAGAAAGDDGDLAFEQVGKEHGAQLSVLRLRR